MPEQGYTCDLYSRGLALTHQARHGSQRYTRKADGLINVFSKCYIWWGRWGSKLQLHKTSHGLSKA
jgi:hypothetical protein